MERVGAYISRLQQQYQQQADKTALMLTVQMLLAELQTEETKNTGAGKVAVILPYKQAAPVVQGLAENDLTEPEPFIKLQTSLREDNLAETGPEKNTEMPAEIPAETPAEIPQTEPPEMPVPEPAKEEPPEKINIPLQMNAAFDAIEDVPTLMHHQPKVVYELNQQIAANDEHTSLNDKLKKDSKELAHKLQDEPIRDLKKAIGINDRYLFLSELFRNDETMYERSIKTINNFNILPEAEYWMQRELKYKLGWDDNSTTVKHFNQLVKRRFS